MACRVVLWSSLSPWCMLDDVAEEVYVDTDKGVFTLCLWHAFKVAPGIHAKLVHRVKWSGGGQKFALLAFIGPVNIGICFYIPWSPVMKHIQKTYFFFFTMGDQCHRMASNKRILMHLLAARKHKMATYCIKYTSRDIVSWFFPLGPYGWWTPSYVIHHRDMFSAYTSTSPVGQNLTPTGTRGIMIQRSGQGFTLSQAFTDHECEIVSDFPSTKLSFSVFFCILDFNLLLGQYMP